MIMLFNNVLQKYFRKIFSIQVNFRFGIKIFRFIKILSLNLISLKELCTLNSNIKFCFSSFGKNIEFKGDGLKFVGTLYKPDEASFSPGIVLVHGANPLAREHAFYKILAKKLAEKGYFVLTFDLRCFGESDNPENVYNLDSWKRTHNDIISAVSYISSLDKVNDSKIYVIGHSAGASPAFHAAIEDKRIKKVVAIGPARRLNSLFKNTSNLKYIQKRFSMDRKMKEYIPTEIIKQLSLNYYALENFIDYFLKDEHVPILMIDGELESKEDREYLKNVYENIKNPVAYFTIPNTGHYGSTASFGKIIIYNNNVLEDFVNLINSWLKDS